MMSAAQPVTMLASALAAYDAGLCVVRTAADGTKKPMGAWKQYQTTRPTRAEVATWFANEHPGMGVICGAVSGDLEMFELEGRFMDTDLKDVFYERIKAAGLELLFKRLTTGYHAVSPSGGRHFIYRVAGPIEGNTKLAQNAANETLIETRGEGGFVVLAPSHGPVHPTGNAWAMRGGSFEAIATITSTERDALFTVARSFNQATDPTPIPVPPVAAHTPQPWTTTTVSSSWMDDVVDHLNRTEPVRAALERYGWIHSHNDRHGRQLMRRPGKDEGVSASINTNGRLCVFSSSTPFEFNNGSSRPRTYDTLDIIATYEHGGDRKNAARIIAEQTGILQAHQHAVTTIDQPAGLAETFWDARPCLTHIRQAARSRLVSPSAVLGAVLARIAAYTPPSSCLPPLIGSTAPLSLYVALRGSSGAGKSSPAAAAADLLPNRPADCVGPLALGSGEGLVEAFMDLVEEEDSNGKKRKVKKQQFHGALFSLDEGQALAEIGARKGSTIMPVLRTAWSGGDPGQANASIETRRTLRPGSYAVGLVSLWQDHAAAQLLADEAGGTPQRFVWFPTDDPEAGDHGIPDWPGEIDWTPPHRIGMNGIIGRNIIDVHNDIRTEVLKARIADLRGDSTIAPLDAHRRLNKLKLAGILAILDNRHDINLEDWQLAEDIMTTSDTVRNHVINAARHIGAQAELAAVDRAVARDGAVETAAVDRSLTRAARAVANKVHRSGPDAVGRAVLRNAMASRDREKVALDDVIAEACRLKWIVPVGGGWVAGEAKPA